MYVCGFKQKIKISSKHNISIFPFLNRTIVNQVNKRLFQWLNNLTKIGIYQILNQCKNIKNKLSTLGKRKSNPLAGEKHRPLQKL